MKEGFIMAMTKFSDIKYIEGFKTWLEFWYADKKAIINCMFYNMQADIDAGYNPIGDCIKRQLSEISNHQNSINNQLDKFVLMDEKQIEKYCYFDLLKRGVID